jgi:hypothetical protein
VSFAAIILCVASQRVFFAVVYLIIYSVRKLFDIWIYPRKCKGKGKGKGKCKGKVVAVLN